MSEQEEFNNWFFESEYYPKADEFQEQWMKCGWQACAEQKNVIIEQQAKELRALRNFTSRAISHTTDAIIDFIATDCELIDDLGNPTPLLTGKK